MMLEIGPRPQGINHETLSLGKWKVKTLTIEVNGEIFHFSLFILGKKFHDWFSDEERIDQSQWLCDQIVQIFVNFFFVRDLGPISSIVDIGLNREEKKQATFARFL